ncbi:MAG: hypothetical protein V7L27_28345 [Nostoc sp.]|uniref:hypothetical protein n=1 Tax=Nostoc sp. TaxID=1180 RepID=UPI002FF54B21
MNQFKIQNDALYETLRERGLALSEAMPFALASLKEKALRCANVIKFCVSEAVASLRASGDLDPDPKLAGY